MAITYEPEYKGHPINTNQEKQQGCDTEILDKTKELLDYATGKHNKILCARLDLRYPKGYHAPRDNKHIQTCMARSCKDLKRKKIEILYIWGRERSREKNQHYHIAYMCDGNKVQYPHKINEIVTKHWKRTINSDNDGLVNYCNKTRDGEKQVSSYRLRRGAEDFDKTYDDCYHRLSYLAKENTKEKDLNGNRRYGGSKIPK